MSAVLSEVDQMKREWIWPTVIASSLAVLGIWFYLDDAARRTEAVPSSHCGRYQTLRSWEKETERRIVVDVLPHELRITITNFGETFPASALKVSSCLREKSGGIFLSLAKGNEAWLRPHEDIEGLLIFGFTDLSFVGETRDGQAATDDFGEHNIPVERVQ